MVRPEIAPAGADGRGVAEATSQAGGAEDTVSGRASGTRSRNSMPCRLLDIGQRSHYGLPMLQAIGVTKHMGSRTLFENIAWQLQRGDRMGLVGPNGAGKTTLMRMLMREEPLDGGSVTCGRDESIGYLPQEAPRHNEGSVIERVLDAAGDVRQLGQQLAATEKALEDASATRATELAAQHADLLEHYTKLGGPTLAARAQEILAGLGFATARLEAPLASLSGGWWMRVELARLLLLQPDYLLLDEPTNHLDLESLGWLENFLDHYSGAWVVVSHDRYFLNRMVNSIAELSSDGLFVFPGNYDVYQQAREQLAAQLEAEARTHAKRVASIQSFVERFRYKASKARQVQSRVKSLERAGPPPGSQKKTRTVHFALPTCQRSGDIVATLEDIHKVYGAQRVYGGLNLQVRRGDKIALLGPNGAGKSTLLKMLAGVVHPDEGARRLGHNVQPYYFAQHQLEILDPKRTVLEEMYSAMPLETLSRVRGILGAFLFSNDAVDKLVSVLSGGEKSRLALAKMLAQPYNFLLLDEPTNHLDLPSRDMLENALSAFTGTVVFISHDRYFINALANQIVEVIPGGSVQAYVGDFDYYLWKHAQEVPAASATVAPAVKDKGDHKSRKQAQRDETRRQREQQRMEEDIATGEGRLKEIDTLMCDANVYNDAPLCKELLVERQELSESLEALYAAWENSNA